MENETAKGRPKLAARLRDVGNGSFDGAAYYLRDRGVKVSGGHLSMICRGIRDPSTQLAKKIARVLGVDISVVVGS